MFDSWRNSLEDLVAFGITLVTPAQQEVLEQGGEVLIIQCLPEPGCFEAYDEFAPAIDQDDELVLVTSVIRSYPVDKVCPPIFRPTEDVRTFGDFLDREVADGEHWSYWPSFAGDMDVDRASSYFKNQAKLYRLAGNKAPMVHIARVWSGTPVVSIGNSVAERVIEACNKRIRRSGYDLIIHLIELSENGQLPWDPEVHPDVLTQVEGEMDESTLQTLSDLRKLSFAGYWDLQTNTYTQARFNYPSMESLLEGDPAARRAWDVLKAQSRFGAQNARNNIPSKDKKLYHLYERDFEPWL